MAFLRAFRLTNDYISTHALLLLRFYLAQYYYLGVLRLHYERARHAVSLTRYSITISRLIGLPFLYLLSLALHHPYLALLHLQPYVFMCCLLLQPRRSYDAWIRLINRFLHLATLLRRLSRRKLKLSWLLVAQLAMKLITLKLYYLALSVPKDWVWKVAFVLLFVLPTWAAIWFMDLSTQIVNLTLTLLLKSFEQLNEELASASDQLLLKIMQADYGSVERLQRRMQSLQKLYVEYGKFTQKLLDCLAYKLLLIVIFNVSSIYALSRHWHRFFHILLLLNSLRLLLHMLDALNNAKSTPHYTSWLQVARFLQFHEVLATHGWLERQRSLRWYFLERERYLECREFVLPQQLQVLGCCTLDRRFFFRIFFIYLSYLYLHYMWHKRLPVAQREIFLPLSLT